jgi:hypothetical protein
LKAFSALKAETDMRREIIQETLAMRAGNSPDAGTVAETALAVWREMAAHLVPLIGAGGVKVLFSRSLYLTGKTLPWLAVSVADAEHPELLAHFKQCLQTRTPADAVAASNTLLVTFTELLESLIGKSLADRLLGPVWTIPSPPNKQELGQHE